MKRGFTLTELLAIICLIGIIMVIAAPNIFLYTQEAKKDKFMEDARTIIKGVELYMEDNDMITLPEEGLIIEDLDLDISGKVSAYTGIVIMSDNEVTIETMSDGKYCGFGTRTNFTVNKVGEDCNYTKE